MKNYRYVIGAFVAALSIISCQKVNNSDEPEVISEGQPFELFASVSETKTSIGENFAVSWNDNDQINVFHAKASSTEYTSDGAFAIDDAENGHFIGTVNGLDATKSYDWYAFYPYDAHVITPASTNKGYVTVGGEGQTQEGNGSYAHIAGRNMPLYGKQIGVNGDTTPEIAMKQICSVIEVKVKNTTDDPLTVSTISFTGTEDIVGTYYINFVGEAPVLTASGEDYVFETVSLSVNDGTALAKNDAACFYVAVKPFTAASGSKLKIAVNGYEKTIDLTKATTFAAGKIKTINFNYDKVAPKYEGEYIYIFDDAAITSTGDVTLNDLLWNVDTDGGYFGYNSAAQQIGSAKASASYIAMITNKYGDPVENITVATFGASDVAATISVTVNGIAYKCGSSTTANLTSSKTLFSFVPAEEAQSGVINISWSNTSAKAIYLKEIDINKQPVHVTSVSVNPTEADITVEGSVVLTATVLPEDADNKSVTWSSSDESIATVNNGVVNGVAPGTATITATTIDGSKTAECVVTVSAVSVDEFALFTSNLTEGDYIIYYDGKAMNNVITSSRLGYESVTPSNNVISNSDASIVWHIAKNGNYWTIYNADVNKYAGGTNTKNQAALLSDATGDMALWSFTLSDGQYEFINKGRENASKDSGNKYLRNNGVSGFACYGSGTGAALSLYKKVSSGETVNVTGISIKSSTSLAVGNTEELVPVFTPSDATNQNVTWESDNTGVATVSNGVVTAVAVGKANITVTTEDGGFTSTCEVTVTAASSKTEITVDFTSTDGRPSNFPTSSSDAGTTLATYNISGYDFDFCAPTAYYWGTYLMIGKSGAYITFPSVEGKKLTKVVWTTTSGISTNVICEVRDSSGKSVYANSTKAARSTTYTWNLSGTANNTRYNFVITNGYNAQIANIVLTYE